MMSQESVKYLAAQVERRHWELGKDRAHMLARLAAVSYDVATVCQAKLSEVPK